MTTTASDTSSSVSSAARLLDATHRRLTIGIVMGISMVGFEALGVSTAMPAVARSLNGLALYGWAFTALLLGQLMGIVLASGDADEHGPFRAYVAAVAAFIVGLAVGSAAPTMAILVGSRFVAGTGAGALLLLNWTLIGRVYPEQLRSKMLAAASSAWVVPGLVGPAAAGWVADHLTWRLVFGAVIAPLILAGWLLIPAARRLGPPVRADITEATHQRFFDADRKARSWAAVCITTGAALALGGLGSHRLSVLAALVMVGGALMAVGGRTLFPGGTWRARPGLPAVVATYALLFAAFTGIESFMPLALNKLRCTTSTESGLILTCGTTTWALGSWMQSRRPPRWASANWRMGATAVLVAGLASMTALTVAGVPAWVTYAGWAAGSLGMGLSFASVSEATFRMVGEHQVGLASGATQLAGALLAALATGVGGAVLDAKHSSATGFRIGFLICVGLAVAALVAGRAVPPIPGGTPVEGPIAQICMEG